jgi:hypothetical protein
MKINKYTAVLAALGLVSLASVAQAANPVIYLTGSTAARGNIFSAMTAGQILTGPVTVTPAGAGSGSSLIVFTGKAPDGTTVDVDCSWSGSEAGIASVAGQTLTQKLPFDPNGTPGVTAWPLPGVGAGLKFLDPNSNYTTQNPLSAITGAPSVPDLTMADTSQAVSRTPSSVYPTHDYGIVGVVTFTPMKGYEATPDAAWNDINNITTAEANQIIVNGYYRNASTVSGVPADSSDGVAIIGRNFGSGTRANAMNNFVSQPILTVIDQWMWSGSSSATTAALLYPSSNPGTLTFAGNYAAGQTLVEIGDDGFDSGGGVASAMNVDGSGSGVVLIGYLGINDAKGAHSPSSGGPGSYIAFNGVYESDNAVEQGSFTYWGYEHVLGTTTARTPDVASFASGLVSGITTAIGTLGGATGDVTTNPAQSGIIPLSKMVVSRNGKDFGFPK